MRCETAALIPASSLQPRRARPRQCAFHPTAEVAPCHRYIYRDRCPRVSLPARASGNNDGFCRQRADAVPRGALLAARIHRHYPENSNMHTAPMSASSNSTVKPRGVPRVTHVCAHSRSISAQRSGLSSRRRFAIVGTCIRTAVVGEAPQTNLGLGGREIAGQIVHYGIPCLRVIGNFRRYASEALREEISPV